MSNMEPVTNEPGIVIVGAGVSGLATALGLHRLGIRSLVLESSDHLRASGVAFTTWPNAWKALDALGVGDALRQLHHQHEGLISMSTDTGTVTAEIPYYRMVNGKKEGLEVRCLKRKILLEILARDLPPGTIRYSSKVVDIEDSEGHLKLLRLADGAIIKAKAVIGCDGINSIVAKWLGFKKAAFAGRCAIRGYVVLGENHEYEPKSMLFTGSNRVRYGIIPTDEISSYWFFAFHPEYEEKDIEENPAKMKEFVLRKMGNVPAHIRGLMERTPVEQIMCSPMKYRPPLQIFFGNISKDNVCVTGDALHPMTPDIAQGACCALEDSVVLARCLGEALAGKPSPTIANDKYHDRNTEAEEYRTIMSGLSKYAKARRWRSIDLVGTAYVMGAVNQSDNKVFGYIRDRILSPFLNGLVVSKAFYNCGTLKTT